jgi:phosphoribosyl-ATP pyrophosphohydrolase/phosphoribosyl-AMP cyclohydrolase
MTDLTVPPDLKFDDRGLIPVVLQHADTGELLTVAFANAEALRRTAESGRTWLFSRSRGELWEKGATSGHVQEVVALGTDCDRDSVVYQVIPRGPACHTGARSCFVDGGPTLVRLQDVLKARQEQGGEGSYTAKLLGNRNLRLKKLGEESVELALACADGPDNDVVYEGADVVYHTLVALRARGVDVEQVLAELRRRFR